MGISISAGGSQSDFTITDNSTTTDNRTMTITLSLTPTEAAQLAPVKAAVATNEPVNVLSALRTLAVENGALLLKVAEIVAKFV